MRTKAWLLAAVVPALAGCAQNDQLDSLPYIGGPDNFGEANLQTFAAQIIDPNPVYGTDIPETSAEHAAQAIDRYRTDKVKVPDRVKTTNAGVSESSS